MEKYAVRYTAGAVYEGFIIVTQMGETTENTYDVYRGVIDAIEKIILTKHADQVIIIDSIIKCK